MRVSGAGAARPRREHRRVGVARAALRELLIDGLSAAAHAARPIAAEEDHVALIRLGDAAAPVGGRAAFRRGARSVGSRRRGRSIGGQRNAARARVRAREGRGWRRARWSGRRRRRALRACVLRRRGPRAARPPRRGGQELRRIGRRASCRSQPRGSSENFPAAQHGYPLSLKGPQQPARQPVFREFALLLRVSPSRPPCKLDHHVQSALQPGV